MGKVYSHYFISRIPLRAKLIKKISNVKSALESYPALNPTKYGTLLKYRIESEIAEEHFYMLEIDKESITIEIHASASPSYFFNEALLRLLSIASVLDGLYEFRIQDLFPYFVYSLAKQQINYYGQKLEKNEGNEDNSDMILAKRINSLILENAILKEQLKNISAKFIHSISTLIIMKYSYNSDVDSITKDNGLERNEVLEALKIMPDLGYRVIDYGNRFNLVKI